MNFHENSLKHHEHLIQSLLNSCSRVRTLKAAKILNATAFTLGSFTTQKLLLIPNNILNLYSSLSDPFLARNLFDQMPHRNEVSYNTLIGAYSRCGLKEQAWEIFTQMRRDCWFKPTQFTFSSLISSGSVEILEGYQVHALVLKNGLFFSNAFVGTNLLGLYGRLGFVDEAVLTFEDIPIKSLVTWNSMVCLLSRSGFVSSGVFLFRELVRMRMVFCESSLVGLLSGFCCEEEVESGEQVHCLIVKVGFDCEGKVLNSLINMYVKCVGFCVGEKLFNEMSVRDVVSWNIMIGSLGRIDEFERALQYFSKMCCCGVWPNSTTFVSLMSCCTRRVGESVHGKVIRFGFGSDAFVGTALVDFYAKGDNLGGARRCFDDLSERNVVSWNALVSGYSKKCDSTSVVLVREMFRLCCRPNEFTFSAILNAALLLELVQLHCLIVKMGYQDYEFVLSALIISYARNGFVTDALGFVENSNCSSMTVPVNVSGGIYNRVNQYDETLRLLSKLDEPDRVSWNIVIEACARNDYYDEVFTLFKQMNLFGIYPDNYTFVSLLTVCATHCNLALGSSLHALAIKLDFKRRDTFVCNVLIDMYGKCGSIESAVKVFNETTERNIITWTTIISALGTNSRCREALERFEEMEKLKIKPDSVVINAALTACRHGGLVREATELFERMTNRYGIEPEMEHFRTLVDLLAKTGHAKEAEKIIKSMPFTPNPIILRSFLQPKVFLADYETGKSV